MNKTLKKLVVTFGILTSFQGVMARTDVGIVGPDGEVLLYYKEGNNIIVKACDFDAFPPEILGTTASSARQNCQGKTNKIPLETFKQALRNMVSADRLNVLKPLAPEEVEAYSKDGVSIEQLEAWDEELTKINNFLAFYGEVDAGSKVARKNELLKLISSESSRMNAIQKINGEIEKVINLIADNSTLTLKRFSKDKDQFLYTVLKQFNPNQKFPCGLKGSVDERIRDCSYQLTSEKEGFVLVTRSKDFKEVHKEVSTGLLWSDRLPSIMNHYNAEKACKATLPEVAGISGVTWRLPSIDEYKEAEKNGIRQVLTNMNYWFWSSSVRSNYFLEAWLFYGGGGYAVSGYRDDYDYSVRCVASTH